MSEPLTYCKVVATECPDNLYIFQEQEYDDSESQITQLPYLEPVMEDSKVYISKLHKPSCSNTNTDNINYYVRSDDTLVYSTPFDINYTNSHTRSSKRKSPNKITAVSSQIETSENIITQGAIRNTKVGRKFRLVNVFIPSVLFVVTFLIISAILVMESDTNIFKQIRNLPEMMSLRYQYYEPLKIYIMNKLGVET